ncbi:MAG: N-acetylmuramoyl-L-alanine amidase [Granulosicoccus sp.]|jgi:N-acetylmuramoyl-L-alanine amidase
MPNTRLSLILATVAVGAGFLLSCGSTPSNSPLPAKIYRSSVKITQALIPRGQYGRSKTRSMSPRYITIHSTQNYSGGANARTHARLLQRGGLTSQNNALGYLTWHFSVDDHSIYQSLPTNEQGQHADYEGTGNRKSIGIEMCENRGNSRSATLDRTARLTADLMRRHNIPLRNVVPHQHWKRIRYSDRRNLGYKNCPNFLMTNGKPGAKWQAFLNQIKRYL